MRNYLIKVISIITIFSMTVAVAVGYIAINRSKAYLETEIEGKILNTSEKYANDFSAQFNHMEGLTDSLAAHVTTSFDLEKYHDQREEYLDQYEEELAEVIKCNLQTTENAHSLYVTFSPDLSEIGREVWFIMKDGKLEEIEVDFLSKHRDFSLPYKKDMAYFFEPKEADGGIWTAPYFDKDISEEVFSYSRAIYVDDVFIGVAGADITAEDIVSTVKDMKLYSGGYSTLLDNNYNMIVAPVQVEESEKELISSRLKKMDDNASGIMDYSYEGKGEILGYSHMDNGWMNEHHSIHPSFIIWPLYFLEVVFALLDFAVAFTIVLSPTYLPFKYALTL